MCTSSGIPCAFEANISRPVRFGIKKNVCYIIIVYTMFDRYIFNEPSRTFFYKAPALEYIAESDDDTLQLFAFDSSDKSGPKGFYAASLHTVFEIIYLNFPVLRKDGRNILYEGIESHQACALAIDLDLKTSETGLEPEDDCDMVLLQVIDKIQTGYKNMFSIETTIKEWLITKSPYSYEKGKHSFHFILTGYAFMNIDDVAIFVKEIDAANLGIDLAIYKVGCLRLVGCTKKSQDRPLTPYKLTDSRGDRSLLPRDFETPFDYFKASTVLYTDGYRPISISEELRVRHRQKKHSTVPRAPGQERVRDHDQITSEAYEVPLDLLRSVINALNNNRADDRDLWCNAVWAIFIISLHNDYLNAGLQLAHDFSRQSGKYYPHDVDGLWKDARPDGINWPSIRGWLWQDNRPVWKALRS